MAFRMAPFQNKQILGFEFRKFYFELLSWIFPYSSTNRRKLTIHVISLITRLKRFKHTKDERHSIVQGH